MECLIILLKYNLPIIYQEAPHLANGDIGWEDSKGGSLTRPILKFEIEKINFISNYYKLLFEIQKLIEKLFYHLFHSGLFSAAQTGRQNL